MNNLANSFARASIVAAFFALSSCTTAYVATKPDEVIIEKPAAPGTGYVFMGPEWKWDKTKKVYVAVPGEWVNRPNGVWVRGHWKTTKHGHTWVPGHWQ